MTQSPSKVMHSCGRAVRRGRSCVQARGLCLSTHSAVCTHGSLVLIHRQGNLLWEPCRVAVPWHEAVVLPHARADALVLLALGTQLACIPAPQWTAGTTLTSYALSPKQAPAAPALAYAGLPLSIHMSHALYLEWEYPHLLWTQGCLKESASLGSATV